MELTFIQKIESAIKDIEKKYNGGLGNTSTKRFETMAAIVSDFFKIDTKELKIVAATKASNVWNRFVEGKAVHNHFKLGIAILSGSDAASAITPIKTFIGSGKARYDSIAILVRHGSGWTFSDIVSNNKKAFVAEFQKEFPHINIVISEAGRVVMSRAEFFSDLEKKFTKWLPKAGVKKAYAKYVRHLKAISLPFVKEPTAKSGKWDGFYEYFIGEKPEKQIFEVNGLEDFKRSFGKLYPFFYEDVGCRDKYDKTKFDKWFEFFHAAPSRKDVANKDQQHTLSAYRKFVDFLTMMEREFGGEMFKFVSQFSEHVCETGLTYSFKIEKQFVSALLAKPFVILTGLSGSGKTKLAESFVRWLCGKPGQANNWKLVSVGADWTNSEKLLGYPDALHEGKYIMPDTGVLQFLLEAKKDEDEGKGIPYFLILDEMNLSHVERYFADFLSAMESVDGVVRLHDSKKIEDDSKVPREFALPRNLFVIGTMNVDETTYMFSPKVLDRAQVIEFRVDRNAMDKYLEGSDNLDLNKLCDEDGKGKGASYASAFLAARKKDYPPVAEAKNALAEFFPILEKLGSEFGFRTASEFRRFASIYVSAGGDPQDAVDFAIMQKLLPKLHGSKRKLSAPLKALWNLCQIDGAEKDMPSIEKEEEFDFGKECRYQVSAKKILRMVRALEVGFASFAEA